MSFFKSLVSTIKGLIINENSVENSPFSRLIESSHIHDEEDLVAGHHPLQWISYADFSHIKPIKSFKHRTTYNRYSIFIGTDNECTQEFVKKFAGMYSLPTHKYISHIHQFKRHSKWLDRRNRMIIGFTKDSDNYYMIADKRFRHCSSLYGFCSACGVLRCSPVWCICGHKELSNGWTSHNHKLDQFIKQSQTQTKSASEAYLEWIPFDCIEVGTETVRLHGLPTYADVKLIPLEISDKTDDSYYEKLCVDHPDILDSNVWMSIGFTYNAEEQTYYLIKSKDTSESYCELCLGCTNKLILSAFCYRCKAPHPLDWTTGNKSLNLFIMESWNDMEHIASGYIQWIEYSQLTNLQEAVSLDQGCTHVADWLQQANGSKLTTAVILKKIADGRKAQSFDFYQLAKTYPKIITPNNIWIVGITQETSTQDYYLVFYRDVDPILKHVVRVKNSDEDSKVRLKFIRFEDFCNVEEIGSGGYGTVYTAECSALNNKRVALKWFKNSEHLVELLRFEPSNFTRFTRSMLKIHGITQRPETKEYLLVMQHADCGNLYSYLERNFNSLTWGTKVKILDDIAAHLSIIHRHKLVHSNLHGGNVVIGGTEHSYYTNVNKPFLCDIALSKPLGSSKSNPSTIRGVLPYVAPEVFHTLEFTQKSDIYSFGILMYQIASGEPPFRDRAFDRDLVSDIVGGLRPTMPDETPESFKKLAKQCCDSNPNKRPDAETLELYHEDVTWLNTVYRNENIEPMSTSEKETKYSSKLLPIDEENSTAGIKKKKSELIRM